MLHVNANDEQKTCLYLQDQTIVNHTLVHHVALPVFCQLPESDLASGLKVTSHHGHRISVEKDY